MKTYSKYFLLFLLTAGLWLGCAKDEITDSGMVELLSYGPAGVKHGDQIRFIGKNLDKVTEIILGGASIAKSAFVSQSYGEIVLVVPADAVRGKAVLKTPTGDIESKALIDFEVPVVITGMPANAKPGENITLRGEYLNWITGIIFPKDSLVTEFVSSSLNELVVTVPKTAETGKLVFLTAGTEPLEIESEGEISFSLPAITAFSPSPIERGANLTITGTDLDLVQGIAFKGSDPVTEFVSQYATELVVVVPEEATGGPITAISFSGKSIASSAALAIIGDLPPLAPLKAVLYNDALQSGFGKWGGWGGGSTDLDNTEKVRDGEKAIKVEFTNSWGGQAQFGGGNMPTAGATDFVLSVFGGPGTNGKKLNVVAKGGATEQQTITVVEGEWTEFKLPLSGYGNPAAITEFFLQEQGWAGIIWVDFIGVR